MLPNVPLVVGRGHLSVKNYCASVYTIWRLMIEVAVDHIRLTSRFYVSRIHCSIFLVLYFYSNFMHNKQFHFKIVNKMEGIGLS